MGKYIVDCGGSTRVQTKTRLLGLALIVGIVALGGCAGTPGPSLSTSDVSGASCAPLPVARTRISLPPPSEASSFPSLATDNLNPHDGLSPKARGIAEVIGILPLVQEARALETSENPFQPVTRQRLLELRQSLSERMMATFFEAQSVASLIDCEAIRADHVADALAETREQRAQQLETIAIVGDAMVGILGGALSLGATTASAAIADVIGGNLGVWFGLAASSTEEKHEFRNPHNYFLRDFLAAKPISTIYPETVWRFLNWPMGKKAKYPTRRQELIAEWRDEGFISKAGATDQRTVLLLGPGGIYDVDDLRVRAHMLEDLKTYVNRMVQQLHLLSQEILNNRHLAARYIGLVSDEGQWEEPELGLQA